MNSTQGTKMRIILIYLIPLQIINFPQSTPLALLLSYFSPLQLRELCTKYTLFSL